MSRWLFVTSPFVAHINPMVSIARELLDRGHDVAWVVDDSRQDLLPPDSVVYPVDDREILAAIASAVQDGNLALANAFKYLVESVIVPLATSMLGPVENAIAGFKPDALFVDHHALAGALAARKAGIVWATSSPSAQLFTHVLDEMERIKAWVQDLYFRLQTQSGVDPIESPDLSPMLVLLYTTPALVGAAEYPSHYRFVGATIRGRVDAPEFPWQELRPGKKVLVSLGSILTVRGERFFRILQEALGGTEVQVIVSAHPSLLPDAPPNFIVREWLPQLELLPEVNAVITHGGSTVNEALAYAVPMVVAPITNDQVIFARCVAESGAGVRVRFRRVTPAELREAVMTVLEEPGFAEAARRIQFSYAAAGGTHAAADALEALVAASKSV